MKCVSCGASFDDELDYCPECGIEAVRSDEDDFNVLYDIDGFDVFEEERFEKMRKQKLIQKIIVVIIVGVLLAFLSIKIVKNMTAAENKADVNYESTYSSSENKSEEANENVAEPSGSSEPGIIDGGSEAEGENDIDELRQEVKRISSNYNNRRTPFGGQLLGVVDDNGDIIATYIIPDALPFEEREAVVEAEEEIKQRFADELSGKFPKEIKVIVKMKVSYR